MSIDEGPFLFLGGSYDGERVGVAKPGQPFRVRPGPDVEDEIYHAVKIAGHSRTFTVYAISGWQGDEIIARLIDGASNPR